jgi:ribosomal protein L21E
MTTMASDVNFAVGERVKIRPYCASTYDLAVAYKGRVGTVVDLRDDPEGRHLGYTVRVAIEGVDHPLWVKPANLTRVKT